MKELSYSIKDVKPGVLELRAHGVKYTLQAEDKSHMELTASKDSVSEYAIRRISGSIVDVDIADGQGLRLTLKSTVSNREIRTDVSLGRKRYRVKSAPYSHAAELARAVGRMTGPDPRFLRWFLKTCDSIKRSEKMCEFTSLVSVSLMEARGLCFASPCAPAVA